MHIRSICIARLDFPIFIFFYIYGLPLALNKSVLYATVLHLHGVPMCSSKSTSKGLLVLAQSTGAFGVNFVYKLRIFWMAWVPTKLRRSCLSCTALGAL